MAHVISANIAVIVLILIGTVTAAGQSVSIVPKFVEGQRLHYNIEKGRKDARSDYSMRSDATLSVIEVTADGTVIEWDSGETEYSDVPAQMRPMIEASAAILEDVNLECSFTPEGEFAGLRNDEEVTAALSLAVKAMIESMAEQANSPDEASQLRSMMEQVLSPELMLASATKEARFFSGVAGLELGVGESMTTETESPSPFGGTLDSEITITVKEVDAEAGTALIDWLTVPNPESIREATMVLMRQMLKTDDVEKIEAAMTQFTLGLTDQSQFTVDLKNGWPLEVRYVRTMDLGPQQRIDRTTLTLTTVDQP